MGLVKPVRDYIDSLVHPSAHRDALVAARHRAFIAPRLLGSLIVLAAIPAYLFARGVPDAIEVAIFAWLVMPILIAYFLSRTGHYEGAHILSSLALTGLIVSVAWKTGGVSSFAAAWLVIVPLEAALSASRRVVAVASLMAVVAAAGLFALGSEGGAPAALGIVSAALYAAGLAFGTEALARTSVAMRNAEEDRYRLLARNMTDVISRHGRQGAVLFISPAAESLFGAKAGDLCGHGLFDRVHVADRPAYLTALADAAAGTESGSLEFRVRHDDARRSARFIWVEMRCHRVAADGATSEVVAVMRDVTERKMQEQALENARTESDRANAAKTRFLATMSHELRTPLNAIIGFSEMLTNEAAMRIDAERRRDYAALINESGHHLLAVVNDILDMSKMETGEFEITPEPFEPEPVIRGCCELLALKARDADITLTVTVDDFLPEIAADKRAVKQVLLNLIANAIKFTDRGGTVDVSARLDGDWMLLGVRDNGIGVSSADLPRLGDPFFQARSGHDRRHDGTGLGLSIVKGLVALHGGNVDVKSTLGQGTEVTVKLPRDCEKPNLVEDKNITRPNFGAESIPEFTMVKKSA